MSDLFWLTDAQMAWLQPYFAKSHGRPRLDDRRVLSGMISLIAMVSGGAMRRGSRARDSSALDRARKQSALQTFAGEQNR